MKACPLCGGSSLRAWERARPGAYSVHPLRVRCGNCGLVFSNPQASAARLEHFYQKLYFKEAGHKADYFSPRSEEAQRLKARHELDRLEASLPAKGRLLDVGAAAGYFLLEARARGWAGEGVELSSQAAAAARRRGLKMHRARLEDLRLKARFDALHCAHTIEHVKDPLGFCRRLAGLVRPGGRLLLEVPNRRALWPLLWHYGDRLKGRAPALVHAKEHTFDFSPATFRLLLRTAGLRVLALRCYDEPDGPLRLRRKGGEGGLKTVLRGSFVAAAKALQAEEIFGTNIQVLAEPT